MIQGCLRSLYASVKHRVLELRADTIAKLDRPSAEEN